MEPSEELLKELWKDCRSVRELGRKLGIHHHKISLLLDRYGLRTRTKNEKARKVDYNLVVEHYKQSQNYHVTAEALGIGVRLVSEICRSYKVNPGKGIAQRRNGYRLPMQEITNRYMQGETCQEIAKDFGVDDEVIRRRLVRRGIKMRRVGARTPEKNSQWSGGKGYKHTHKARGIAQSYLKQKLPEGMVVHHHNESPLDNSIDNLWIFPDAVSHLRYHGKLRYLRNQGHEVDANLLARENGGLPLREFACQIE